MGVKKYSVFLHTLSMLIVKLDKEYSLIIKNFDEGDFINRTIFLNDLLENIKIQNIMNLLMLITIIYYLMHGKNQIIIKRVLNKM